MSELNSLIQLINKGSDLGFQMESDYNDFSSNTEATDFMSSEFFDSILSLEKEGADMELGECGLSTYSDSGLSSELNTDQLLSDEELFSVCSMLEQTASSDGGSEAGEATVMEATTVAASLSPAPITTAPPAKPAAIVAPLKHSQPKLINIIKPSPKQVLKIQTVGGNQRSLLLPINIKDLKTIKIINTNSMKAEDVKITSTQTAIGARMSMQAKRVAARVPEQIAAPSPIEQRRASTDAECDDEQYPPLTLTPEEKRLLCKDGIQLPIRYPLSKSQERELKRIRRKIRNKISAQDSRKRKKEYVDGLEERVKQCSEENRSLMKKIKLLQTQNNKLSSQLSKLQALIFKSGTTRAHPATCLMIVVLSVMLVSLPNLRNLSSDKELNSLQQFVARRALLFDQQATNEDIGTDAFQRPESSPPGEERDAINATKKRFSELFVQIGQSIMAKLGAADGGGEPPIDDDGSAAPLLEQRPRAGDPPKYDGKATRKRTIEFDIDDTWPPEKKNATASQNVIHHVL